MPNQRREIAFANELFRRLDITVGDVQSMERPDVTFRLEEMTVGLEITESTPAEKYRGQKIAQELNKGSLKPLIYSTTHLMSHGRKRTRDELFHDMFNNRRYVDLTEQHSRWCEDVRSQWARKRRKLNEASYSKFDENWLLVWDNDGLGDDICTLTNIQSEVRKTNWFSKVGGEFHHIYVISGNFTFDFIPGKETKCLSLY